MPMTAPTTGEIGTSQGFKATKLPKLLYKNWVGKAKLGVNAYTGLPVKKPGRVNIA